MPKTTDIAKILAKFGIDSNEVAAIREAGTLLKDDMKGIIEKFYSWLSSQEEFSVFFSNDINTLNRVKELQSDFWTTFFYANIDEKYFAARRYIGAVHAHIELPNDIFFAAMSTMNALLTAKLCEMVGPTAQFQRMENAISKMMFLDSYLVLDEISQIHLEKIEAHSRSLNEISTPVTPIWEGILLLPLLGVVDSARSQDIMNKTLSKIDEMRAKVFVMDISGVATVDTAVANQLIKITKATKLMGCESIISGISPAIARTLVELGISIGEVRTTSTLRDALELGLRSLGETHRLNVQNIIDSD